VLVHSYISILTKRYRHPNVIYIPHGTQTGALAKVDPEEKVILIFGHMGPHKGLPLLIDAFKQMRREKINVKLMVAGADHPNFPNYLKEFIKLNIPNVEFLGYVPEEKLEQVFKTADVLVMPYLAVPGTSGVFHLACGYGTPVVASDLPEIREILADGASAMLVPSQNVSALKNAILKVLFEKGVAENMSAQNLLFAQKRNWSTVAEAYEQAYINLLKH
jgi:glycosyltransferase involved in cell wall biosynthesis